MSRRRFTPTASFSHDPGTGLPGSGQVLAQCNSAVGFVLQTTSATSWLRSFDPREDRHSADIFGMYSVSPSASIRSPSGTTEGLQHPEPDFGA